MVRLSPLLLALPIIAAAETYGPACNLQWDYNPDDLLLVNQFVVIIDGVDGGTVPSPLTMMTCLEAGIQTGVHDLQVVAQNSAGRSDPSNTIQVNYVSSPPPSVTGFRITITVPGPDEQSIDAGTF